MQEAHASPPPPDKSDLRRQLRVTRQTVPREARRKAGKALVRHALRHHLLAAGKRVGFYMPTQAEIDVLPLLRRAYVMGVHCYLPIVPGRNQRKLWFTHLDRPIRRCPHWYLNRFGIQEYQPPGQRRIRGAWLRTVFMPLLGFDRRGHRIGMGGGYYDASLAFRTRRMAWHGPRLIGVAFSAQEIGWLPNDAWDVPLDGVLTERGLLRSRNRTPSASLG
ncbi:MAG TPA: 5-formyltetrahydrofolate cyclo-ligase [Thiobacillaceae bacterium]|nr:5-formyltetrahydrofolate cyclo-ligase [Thiobacillaceae bacterium]HNU64553.1 5-formyltetrahydrofolate cyclo-ligase [Thiobacillaceae bacterium]